MNLTKHKEVFINVSGCPEHNINNGHCYNFAYFVYQTVPNVRLLSSDDDGYHAFIKIDDKYYDSDCPEGVEKHTDLPTFKEKFKLQYENSKFCSVGYYPESVRKWTIYWQPDYELVGKCIKVFKNNH